MGSSFSVSPETVYHWGCGQGGFDTPPEQPGPTLSQIGAAWVVLITQMSLYFGLSIYASSRKHEEGQDFAVLAIAGAMGVLLSTAGPDLQVGVGLCLEGTQNNLQNWFWPRKVFGFIVVVNFVLVVKSSVLVLFSSSFGNMEFVVGAASVLFIADVDKKAKVVLGNVEKKWSLFWAIECLGLGLCLALSAVKFTESGEAVARDGGAGGICGEKWAEGCSIYDWRFLADSVIAVTVFALFVSLLVRHVEENVVQWPGTARVCSGFSWVALVYFIRVGGFNFEFNGQDFQTVYVGLVIGIIAAASALARMTPRGRYSWFLWLGLGILVCSWTFGSELNQLTQDQGSPEDSTESSPWDSWIAVTTAVLVLAAGALLIWGMLTPFECIEENAVWMLFGWGLCETFSASCYLLKQWRVVDAQNAPIYDVFFLLFTFIIVILLKGEGADSNHRIAAFWAGARLLLGTFFGFVHVLMKATEAGFVKFI